MDIITSIILIIFSTVFIAKACDGFEAAADYLGRNLSEGVKGASINAIGSSMPELFATFVFLFIFADTSGFAGGIGTTAGSAVFNSMIIPAFAILTAMKLFQLASVPVSKKVVLRDGLTLIAVEFILIVAIGETLQWWHGLMLMLLYLGYAGYMFVSMGKSDNSMDTPNTVDNPDADTGNDNDTEERDTPTPNRLTALFKMDLESAIIAQGDMRTNTAWVLLGVTTLFVAVACFLLVYGCERFGHALGIHGYFVAVILAAGASSVPDTILSIRDARKGNYDDALSNALGSNIFDICFALGLPLFLYTLINGEIVMPVGLVEHISELRILLLLLTIVVFLIFCLGRGLGKAKASTLLLLYALFTIYVVARAYEQPWIEPVADLLHTIQRFLQ